MCDRSVSDVYILPSEHQQIKNVRYLYNPVSEGEMNARCFLKQIAYFLLTNEGNSVKFITFPCLSNSRDAYWNPSHLTLGNWNGTNLT